MRGITVTLAFLFLTGAQARHFWQQDAPPASHMEQLQEQIRNYMETAKANAREMIAQVDASNFGQHFDLDLATKVEMAAAVAEQLRENLAPHYQAARERWDSDYQQMTAELEPIRAKVAPLLEELNDKLQEVGEVYYAKMTPLVEEFRHSAREDLQLLQTKLEPITTQALEKMRGAMGNFRQQATPYVEEMKQLARQKMQQVQEQAMPRMQEFRTIVQEKVANLREATAPVVDGLRQRMEPALKVMQERMATLLATIQRSMEEHSAQQS